MTDINQNSGRGSGSKSKSPGYPDLSIKSTKEQKELREIWQKSISAKPVYQSQPKEIEKSLSRIHNSLGFTKTSNTWWNSTTAKRLLIAACLLVTVTVGYFSYPKKVTAPTGQIKAVTLPDGSNVTLNSGSHIKYNRLFSFFSSTRLVYLKGEAFFDVVPSGKPFSVKTAESIVKVTGTRFNVRAWPEEASIDIAVLEGSIQWHPINQPKDTVALHAGQASLWNITTDQHQLNAFDDSRYYTGWKSSDFAFKNRPLNIIFSEMERRFGISIDVGPNVSPMQTLTTYYPDPPSAVSILEDICRVKGLKYIKTNNGFRVVR